MSDQARMRDEGLTIGQPLVIWLSVVERFIDERPATLVRNDYDETNGTRRLLVRDETNGVLRSFFKLASDDVFVEHEHGHEHEQAPFKRCVAVVSDERRDVVVMHERARVQSCDLCGEPDVFGARGNSRSRCGRCLVARDCAPATSLAAPVNAVDADLARALVRFEIAIEDAPHLRRTLAELDGLAPWSIASGPFAHSAWRFNDVLDARTRLVEAMWRGELVHGATVQVATHVLDDAHPWCTSRGVIAFVVEHDVIRVRATDDVVAERVA